MVVEPCAALYGRSVPYGCMQTLAQSDCHRCRLQAAVCPPWQAQWLPQGALLSFLSGACRAPCCGRSYASTGRCWPSKFRRHRQLAGWSPDPPLLPARPGCLPACRMPSGCSSEAASRWRRRQRRCRWRGCAPGLGLAGPPLGRGTAVLARLAAYLNRCYPMHARLAAWQVRPGHTFSSHSLKPAVPPGPPAPRSSSLVASAAPAWQRRACWMPGAATAPSCSACCAAAPRCAASRWPVSRGPRVGGWVGSRWKGGRMRRAAPAGWLPMLLSPVCSTAGATRVAFGVCLIVPSCSGQSARAEPRWPVLLPLACVLRRQGGGAGTAGSAAAPPGMPAQPGFPGAACG